MKEALSALESMGLLTTDNTGGLVVDLSQENLGFVRVKKSDGATLYVTRDIAGA